jgi:CDP-diacylglycerol--serine O-phosphatidyltransferase
VAPRSQTLREQPRPNNVGLPNLLTLACLGLGFVIVGAAGQGKIHAGLRFLAFCLLADSLAGKAALKPGASTELGAELDSLAALVAYGVAVPLLAFSASLEAMGAAGWAACGALALASGLRLSRDNASSPDVPHYQGLPPAASALLLAGALVLEPSASVYALICGVAAVLMMAPLNYPRLKLPLHLLAPLGLLLVLAALDWSPAWIGLFIAAALYAAGGWAWARSPQGRRS